MASLDVEARSLREDQHAGDQNKGPSKLDGDGNAV